MMHSHLAVPVQADRDQLQSRAENGSPSITRHLLSGTQTCGLEAQQTDDTFGAITTSDLGFNQGWSRSQM